VPAFVPLSVFLTASNSRTYTADEYLHCGLKEVHMHIKIMRKDVMLDTEAINLHFDTRGALYITTTRRTIIIKHLTCQQLERINREIVVDSDAKRLMKQMSLIGQS
jgi:hypothetical protein